MNKKILATISLILLIFVVALIAYSINKPKNTMMSSDNKMDSMEKKVEDKAMTSDNEEMKEPSRYVKFENGLLEKMTDKRRVLFFYASWCPTCRPADADITANSKKIPDDVVVIRVNYNDPDTETSEKDLAKKYAVTYQHTFVQIDKDGREVKKWNGGSFDELLTNISN